METDGIDTLIPFFEDAGMRISLPNILTLKDEVYIGQELFLVQGTEMKIVEVLKISDSEGIIHLRVKDLCDQEIIEFSCSYDFDQEYSISWMIISIPYIVELVIERMKQQFRG